MKSGAFATLIKLMIFLIKLMIFLSLAVGLSGCGGISGEITSLFEDDPSSAWSTIITTDSDLINITEGDGLTVLSGLEESAKTDVTFQWEITPKDTRFVASSGSGEVLTGKKNFSFLINTVEDSLFQGNSSYTLRIWGSSFENEVHIQLNVIDDETHIGLSLAPLSVNESAGTVSLVFTLSNVATEDVTFDYTTNNSTAIAGVDYTAISGTMTIPAGQTQVSKSLLILSDGINEENETFKINITNASNAVTILTPSTTVTIIDDDATPTLAVNDVTSLENSGASVFTINLSAISGKDISVNYTVSGVTALIGVDFQISLGTVTIPAGQLTATVSVPLIDDTIYEGNETFTLDLSSPSSATLSDAQGIGAISDDESPPVLSITNASANEDSGTIQFTVTKTGNTVFPLTVDYSTSNATATAGSDYTATSGTLAIAAGSTSGTISIPLVVDAIFETDETFSLALSNPTGATIATATATGQITNDDSPTISGISPTEGSDAGGTTLTISGAGFLSGATATVGGAICTSPTVVSSGSFTCITPAGTAGAVDVVLSNSAGSQPSGPRTVTSTGGYTYRADSWNFGTTGHFTYDASLFTTSSALNKATLTPLDLTQNMQAEFDAGTHLGTTYDGATSSLTIDKVSPSTNELESSWAPQWNNLVWYWKMNGSGGVSTSSFAVDKGGTTCVASSSTDATYSTGKLQQGIGLTANLGYTNCAGTNVTSLSNNMSLGGWIKQTGGTAISYENFIDANDFGAPPRGWNVVREGTTSALYLRVDTSAQTNAGCTASNYAVLDGAWHYVFFTLSSGSVKFYVDGNLANTCSYSHGTGFASGVANFVFRRVTTNGTTNYDDWGVWNTVLDSSEVGLIYNRQKQKYSGLYISPVSNSAAAASWTKLSWFTSLPFFKQLPGDTDSNGSANSESAANYSAISAGGADLGNSLAGLWHMNETSWNGTAGEVRDSSGNGVHGTSFSGATTTSRGFLNAAGSFSPSKGVMFSASDFDYEKTQAFTACAIVNGPTPSSSGVIFAKSKTSSPFFPGWGVETLSNGKITFWMGSSGTAYIQRTINSVILDGRWHTVCYSYDGSSTAAGIKGYLDGKLMATTLISDSLSSGSTLTTDLFYIGGWSSIESLTGLIDEAAIWSRALSDAEILQLYRRIGNRNKFQFRTCTQSDCSDNPSFKGPDNTAATWFSELHNMASIAATGSGSGNVNLASPLLDFTKWIAAVAGWGFSPDPARYFQYRALLESDDENNLCGATPCMPDISPVAVIPAVSITTTVGRAFPSALTQFNVMKAGDCGTADDVRFQVSSDDGTTYKYWNGSAWTLVTTTASYAQAAAYTVTNTNIGALASSGTFKFKSLVPSQFGKTCELSNPYIRW